MTASRNKNGVYENQIVEVLARKGERSFAEITVSQCVDGLYRFGHRLMYSYGGSVSPITDRTQGYPTAAAAKEAAAAELLARFPRAWASEPQSVQDELRELKAQIDAAFRQPSLF